VLLAEHGVERIACRPSLGSLDRRLASMICHTLLASMIYHTLLKPDATDRRIAQLLRGGALPWLRHRLRAADLGPGASEPSDRTPRDCLAVCLPFRSASVVLSLGIRCGELLLGLRSHGYRDHQPKQSQSC